MFSFLMISIRKNLFFRTRLAMCLAAWLAFACPALAQEEVPLCSEFVFEATPFFEGPGPMWAWLGKVVDLDGDGKLDIVGTPDPPTESSRSFFWWQGASWTKRHIGGMIGLQSMDVMDIDGDGLLDLIEADIRINGFIWLRNVGTPYEESWTGQRVDNPPLGLTRRLVFARDADRDNDTDVFLYDHETNNISWWENRLSAPDNDWVFHDIDLVGHYPSDFGDIDGDGDLDILSNGVSWLENDGTPADGGWVEHVDPSVSGKGFLFDINKDGALDIMSVFDTVNSSTIDWYENKFDSGEREWLQHPIGISSCCRDYWDDRIRRVVDFDGDGDSDFIGGKNTLWINESGDGLEWRMINIRNSEIDFGNVIGFEDLDGDGEKEFISGNSTLRFVPAVYDAEFVRENIPDSIDFGERFEARVTFRNTGNAKWTAACPSLAIIDDTCGIVKPGTIPRAYVASYPDVMPGEEYIFGFPIQTPETSGDCSFKLQMVNEHVEFFGEAVEFSVRTGPNAAQGWELFD